MTRRFPFQVIPTGWFVVAISDELKPGTVVRKRYFGQELALYRSQAGEVRMVDAFCPHLGAHLGRSSRVEGETLRCKFHGFSYGLDGDCVGNRYLDPPPPLRLKHWDVQEHGGLILAWHDALGRDPEWEVPVLPQDGFNSILWRRFTFPGHPQETTENSVDFGHFLELHNFPEGASNRPVHMKGPVLRTEYSIRRRLNRAVAWPTMYVEFVVNVHGLGYSRVDVSMPGLRTEVRLYVLPIPIDGENIDLVLGTSVRSRVPLTPRVMRYVTRHMLCTEVAQDIAVWQHKIYIESPKLAKSEGAVASYRRWCKQFYPEVEDSPPSLRESLHG